MIEIVAIQEINSFAWFMEGIGMDIELESGDGWFVRASGQESTG